MAMDMKWLLSAKDDASSVFDKVKSAGTGAADGIDGAFKGVLGKFNLLTGAVGSLVAVAGGMALKSIVSEYVNWELSVAKLAGTMGSSTEEASVFAVAMHTYGVENDVAEKAALKLAMTIGKNEEVFQKLGVDVRDSNGHLRATTELMPEVNQALSEMKAGTDRNTIAMQVYGKSWNDVRALLKITPEAMEEARATAERLHLIVGDEGVKKAKEYKKNMNEIELVAKSLKIQLGEQLLPAVVAVGSYMGKNAPVIGEAFGGMLMFVGKTAATLGEWIGLMAYRVYALGSAVANVLTGNLSGAKAEMQNIVSAGEDFNKKAKERWSDWTYEKPKSKDPKGDQAEQDLSENNIKTWEKELAVFKENQTAKSAIAKAQADVRGAVLKAEFDQGEITAQEYYQWEHDSVMKAAQIKVDAAQEYLAKETDVLNKIAEANGKSSNEYLTELAKHDKAVAELQTDLLAYGKTYVETNAKLIASNKAVEDGYIRIRVTALETAGEYVKAEQIRQEMDKKSAEYLRLEKKALSGNALAVQALAYKKQAAAVAALDASQKEKADIQAITDATFDYNQELRKQAGVDQSILDAEKAVYDSKKKLIGIQNQLDKATLSGASAKIKALEAEKAMQELVNSSKQKQIDLEEQIKVLSGEIVGFNGTQAIYANQATAGQYQYQSAAQILSQRQTAGTGSTSTSSNSQNSNSNSPFVSLNTPSPYVSKSTAKSLVPADSYSSAPAASNTGSSISVNGDLNFTLPNVTNQTTASELARQVWPELKRLAKMSV